MNYIIFCACRYIALTASVKVPMGSPKTVRNESLCAPKVIQEVTYIFGAFMHMMDCSCAPILGFSLRRQLVLQQSDKFRTTFLVNQFFYYFDEG